MKIFFYSLLSFLFMIEGSDFVENSASLKKSLLLSQLEPLSLPKKHLLLLSQLENPSLPKKNLHYKKETISPYFSQKRQPFELHNQALEFFHSGDKTLSILLFRKNFYQHFFFPSYKVLKSLGKEVSLAPVFWQIGSLLFALLSLIGLVFSLKQDLGFKSRLKWLSLWFCGLTILASSGFFNLRERGGNLKELELLNAPFEKALPIKKIEEGSDLIFLKRRGEWAQVKSSQNKGWLLEKELIKILE